MHAYKNSSLLKRLAISLLLLCPAAFAEESRLENQAGRCSAIFQMLYEAFQENPARAPLFRHFSGVFNELYLKEKKERTGQANAEDGMHHRSALLQEFRSTYEQRQAGMKEEVVLCGAWAEGYRAQGEVYSYVPIIPKLIPSAVREEYEALAVAGWPAWLRQGLR